jgi:hypothetical protein
MIKTTENGLLNYNPNYNSRNPGHPRGFLA